MATMPDPNVTAQNLANQIATQIEPTLASVLTTFQQQTIAAVPQPPAPVAVPLLKQLLPAGATPKVGIHTMLWFQQATSTSPANNHVKNTRNADGSGGVLYNSNSPAYLASLVKMYLAAGADFAIVDWYGSQNTFIDGATKNFLAAAAGTPLKVGIMVDKGAIKGASDVTTAFINEVHYIMSTYWSNPNFFTDFISDFACAELGINWSTVQSTFPNVTFVHDSGTYGKFFTWAPNQAVSVTTGHYTNANCVMGSVHRGFFDGALLTATGTTPNFNASVWSQTTIPSVRHHNRVVTSDEWFQLWAAIPTTMKYVQVITGQDYEEGTALEGMLSM